MEIQVATHAVNRLFERTKLSLNDVRTILQTGATVSIGSVPGRKFLLFYSPPDRNFRIAVMSEEGSHLISILKPGYRLPKRIGRIKDEHREQARQMLAERMPDRFKEPGKSRRMLSCMMEVYDGNKHVYNLPLGEIPENSTWPEIIVSFDSDIRVLLDIVEVHRERFAQDIRYRFNVSYPFGSPRTWTITHAKLQARLRTV